MCYVWNTYFRTLDIEEMNMMITKYTKNYEYGSFYFEYLKKKFSHMDFISDPYVHKFDLLKIMFGPELVEHISDHNKTQLIIKIFSDRPGNYITENTRPVLVETPSDKLKMVFAVYKSKTKKDTVYHDNIFYKTLGESVDVKHNFYSIYYWMTRSIK